MIEVSVNWIPRRILSTVTVTRVILVKPVETFLKSVKGTIHVEIEEDAV